MSARMASTRAHALMMRAAPAARSSFSTSGRRLAETTTATHATVAPPLPARKPVGAFRGGIFGFLLGSTLAGGGVYGYVLQEYKSSNELLTEDIYALQAACHRLSKYVQSLEDKMDASERKRK